MAEAAAVAGAGTVPATTALPSRPRPAELSADEAEGASPAVRPRSPVALPRSATSRTQRRSEEGFQAPQSPASALQRSVGGAASCTHRRSEEGQASRTFQRLRSQTGLEQHREVSGQQASDPPSPSKAAAGKGDASEALSPSAAPRKPGADAVAKAAPDGGEALLEEPFPAKRLACLAACCVVLVIVGHATGATDELSAEHIGQMVRGAGVFGCLVVAAVMSLGELVHVPAVIVYGACIMIYGKAVGFLVGWFAVITSVTFSFFVVRAVGGRGLAHLKSKRIKAILAQLDKRPFTVVVVLRVVLFAAPLLNYALALSDVSFKHYFAGSAIGIIPPLAFIAVTLDQFMLVRQLIASESTLSPAGHRIAGLRGTAPGVVVSLGNGTIAASARAAIHNVSSTARALVRNGSVAANATLAALANASAGPALPLATALGANATVLTAALLTGDAGADANVSGVAESLSLANASALHL